MRCPWLFLLHTLFLLSTVLFSVDFYQVFLSVTFLTFNRIELPFEKGNSNFYWNWAQSVQLQASFQWNKSFALFKKEAIQISAVWWKHRFISSSAIHESFFFFLTIHVAMRRLFVSQTSTVGSSQSIWPFASLRSLLGCCADKVNFTRWSSCCGWLWGWLWTAAEAEGKAQ